MMRHGLPTDMWKRSSYSEGGANQCVETQMTADGLVAVGDSKDRPQGAFTFAPSQWRAFVESVKTDEFDL